MADAPVLTEVQRLTIQNKVLLRDNAQLRLDALVKELLVDGYTLTGDGDYVKQADAPAP